MAFCLVSLCPGATLTLICSCGSNPGSIWRGCGLVLTRTTAAMRLHLQPHPTRTWAGVRSWCPMPWRSWAEQPPLPPPRHPAAPPPSHPSRTRTLPANIATRNHEPIIQRWSRGWWWRPDRAQSWRTVWEARRNCWSGSSATEACWRQKKLNPLAQLIRLVLIIRHWCCGWIWS